MAHELFKYYRNLPLIERRKIFNRQMELSNSGFASDKDFVQHECFEEAVKEYQRNLNDTTIVRRKRGRPRKQI